MKGHLLAGALLIIATSVTAAPPPYPFAAITWHSTAARPLLNGIGLGQTSVQFEKTTLQQVLSATKAGSIEHAVDAGDSNYSTCYAIAGENPGKLWLLSDGEMGGPDHTVTGFVAVQSDAPASKDCPALPASAQPIAIAARVGLGATDADIRSAFGAPSHTQGAWTMYGYSGKVPGKCGGGADLLNWLSTKSTNGRVIAIYAGQVTSC